MISSETIDAYLTRLASRAPTPGGGAAAALHAAQGAALVGMVARYTTGPKYGQHTELVQRIIETSDELVAEALRLADADQLAFQRVIDAYGLPSGSPELKAARTESVQAALILAADPPTRLLGLAGSVVDLATELFDVANATVISDIAAAADAARAAASTARVNIDVNVVAIRDSTSRAQVADRTDGLEEKVILAADALVGRVRTRILG